MFISVFPVTKEGEQNVICYNYILRNEIKKEEKLNKDIFFIINRTA